MNKQALGIVDYQRGFIPAKEGERLGMDGFGELGVQDGERIRDALNVLIKAFTQADQEVFTTQDWHPPETAHFDDEPDFDTTWPIHCVAETPGAALHPELLVPESAERFKKGTEPLARGEEDTSYSGFNGHNEQGQTLGEWLQKQEVTHLFLGGLALDKCVMATAIDGRDAGLEVTVIANATEPVTQAGGVEAIRELIAHGVGIETADQVMERLRATA